MTLVRGTIQKVRTRGVSRWNVICGALAALAVVSATRQAIGSCAQVDADHLEFQDDACQKKRTPSNHDRTVSCPIVSTVTAGFALSSAPVVVDGTALKGIVPEDVDVTAILIRRVAGVQYYRYLSNGTHDDAFQPWSSTKFMAAAGAGAALRKASGGKVGLTAKAANGAWLGDLVTVIASYREDRYTSNGLAHYFLNVAGRAHVMSLVHDWLGRPTTETYGGNYGVPAPTDLGYTFTEPNGAAVSVAPDDQSGIPNHLSTHTLAEFMKRLGAWDDAPTRLPDLTKPDVETLFYGPASSAWYPGELGGLAADTTIYVQSALDMDAVEKDSRGHWRTFGKLGFGDGEFVLATYTCLPVLDAAGAPIPDRGAEIVIATRATSGSAAWVDRDQQLGTMYRSLLTKGLLPAAQTQAPASGDGGIPATDGAAPATSPPATPPGSPAAAPSDDSSGCSATGRSSSPRGGAWLGLSLALAALVARSRRPRSRPQGAFTTRMSSTSMHVPGVVPRRTANTAANAPLETCTVDFRLVTVTARSPWFFRESGPGE